MKQRVGVRCLVVVCLPMFLALEYVIDGYPLREAWRYYVTSFRLGRFIR